MRRVVRTGGATAAAGQLCEYRTAAGRDIGELRPQCLGSITLSELVEGAVYGPQQGAYFFGPFALANAMRAADESRANRAQPHQWRMPRFAGFVLSVPRTKARPNEAAGPPAEGR